MNREALWNRFAEACEFQWRLGGKRYVWEDEKEYTDLVCEVVGNRYIGGNILKYPGEIWGYKERNELLPETNFFKIAVWTYIWWLKELVSPTGNTGMKLKKAHWQEFKDACWKQITGVGMEGEIKPQSFIDAMLELINGVEGSIENEEVAPLFYMIVHLAFEWWCREQGNFTQIDEGEKFKE